jgi:hypothetical protein
MISRQGIRHHPPNHGLIAVRERDNSKSHKAEAAHHAGQPWGLRVNHAHGPMLARRALFQGRAIAGRTSYVVPCARGAPFNHNEARRKAVNADLTIGTVFGNGSRSGPPAMGAAKRDGPSIQRGHGPNLIIVCDRICGSALRPRDCLPDTAPYRPSKGAPLHRSASH